ncbi:MAG: cupin domain-containing protein [Thaumarchaeota archaeon]|jgi:quercetin dioxygenase-like cupin family protein|nr:cupin domain-containing protein [Candidatus Geocrenenecus arthurdayi]
MVVRSEESIKPIPIEDAEQAFIQPLITRFDGALNIELRKISIKPGGRIPAHLHPEIEHVQYVLKGRYLVKIGQEIHEVKPGDAILIPPNTVHYYENNGDEEAVFLCTIPRKEYTTVTI